MSDLVFLPAHQLATLIRDRQVSATEVLEAHLQQIAQHNPKINAFITLDEETARQRAKAADNALANGENWGSLHGVPITVKDCFETAGLRTTCGWKGLADYVPQQDATVVARIRAAGAIILGKTNLSILASDLQSNSDFGRVNNPWNLGYTAGGSSGSSAAAVAAGFSPLDLCTGMGGSGRIPAHFCGVFGMKPTEYRVSMAGAWAEPLEGNSGLQLLSDQHCIVEKQNPPNFDFAAALETLGNLIGAWASTRPIPKRPTLRDDLRRLISGGPLIKSVLRGTRFNLKHYGAALVERDRFTSQLEQFLSQWDVWICPTVAFPAFPHQPVGKSFEIEGESINYLLGGVNYTGLFTLTGHPVVVVPIGQTKAGLPIAIQIVGKRWHERSVLAFAGKLTDMIGGWQCPPGY